MSMKSYRGRSPELRSPAFVADSADLIGAVRLEEGSSVWYHVTLRADLAPIVIGRGSNVQDNSCIHVEAGHPCIVGEAVTIGHSVTLHACTVEDAVLIGMGATVLDGAVIGRGSIVGANALVTKNSCIPPYSLALGSPAKVVRYLGPDSEEQQRLHARNYVALAREYAAR